MAERKPFIARAIRVLTSERENVFEARKKFEVGGNLYSLIEKDSAAARERVQQMGAEIEELTQAIKFLEQEG